MGVTGWGVVLIIAGIFLCFLFLPLGILFVAIGGIAFVVGIIGKIVRGTHRLITHTECPYCRSKIKKGAVVCPICRQPLTMREGYSLHEKRYCKFCGEQITVDTKFCPKCGKAQD